MNQQLKEQIFQKIKKLDITITKSAIWNILTPIILKKCIKTDVKLNSEKHQKTINNIMINSSNALNIKAK